MRTPEKGGLSEEGETEGWSKFLKIKQRNKLSRRSFAFFIYLW